MFRSFDQGDRTVCREVRIPTPEEEDAKRLDRERLQLSGERTRHVNRIRALLNLHGIREVKALWGGDWRKWLQVVRTADDQPLGKFLAAELTREFERLELVHAHIRDLDRQLEEGLKDCTLDIPNVDKVHRIATLMRQIRQAVGSNVVDPKLLTYAEKLQYEGYLRRQETNEAIRELSKKGTSIRQIVRQTGHSRKLVRDVLRGQRLDVFRTRPSSLDSWLPWLNGRWEEGARNALALWREMKTKGFPGQSGVISQWAQRRRLAEKANQSGLARTPSARVIARLMTTARDDLAKAEAILVAAIEVNVPELVIARAAIGDFQSMIRSKNARKLDEWLDAAKDSPVGSFASGVARDLAAVRNAIISPWSNGQTEGQITRLKLIKRQMYGRAKLDLLQARLVGVR
jgi:transposase